MTTLMGRQTSELGKFFDIPLALALHNTDFQESASIFLVEILKLSIVVKLLQ